MLAESVTERMAPTGVDAPVEVGVVNASAMPATANAMAMRTALGRKYVVRLLISGGIVAGPPESHQSEKQKRKASPYL